jgi:hypothetical protein
LLTQIRRKKSLVDVRSGHSPARRCCQLDRPLSLYPRKHLKCSAKPTFKVASRWAPNGQKQPSITVLTARCQACQALLARYLATTLASASNAASE